MSKLRLKIRTFLADYVWSPIVCLFRHPLVKELVRLWAQNEVRGLLNT